MKIRRGDAVVTAWLGYRLRRDPHDVSSMTSAPRFHGEKFRMGVVLDVHLIPEWKDEALVLSVDGTMGWVYLSCIRKAE